MKELGARAVILKGRRRREHVAWSGDSRRGWWLSGGGQRRPGCGQWGGGGGNALCAKAQGRSGLQAGAMVRDVQRKPTGRSRHGRRAHGLRTGIGGK